MDNSEKFEAVYSKYRVLMYRVAYGLLGNPEDAEDAVQSAFVKIYGHIADIADADSPRTRSFVTVVVRNVCFNMLRDSRHNTGADIEQLDPVSDISIEEQALSGFGVVAIENALRGLPENYRDILYLTAYEELDLHSAAELLGITYENAKSRLKRARRKLAELLA